MLSQNDKVNFQIQMMGIQPDQIVEGNQNSNRQEFKINQIFLTQFGPIVNRKYL